MIKNSKKAFLFLFFMLLIESGYSQTMKECDSLIQNGVKLMYNQKYIQSIKLLVKTKEIATKNNWYKQYFLSTNNLGLNYFRINDYPSAIQYFLKAYTASIKKNESLDEMAVLNNIAILYVSEGKSLKAETYFLKGLQTAKKINDSIKIGSYLTNLGLLATEQNQISKAKAYLSEARFYLGKEKRVLFSNDIGFLQIYLKEKKYALLNKKAKNLLQNALQENFLDAAPSIELTLGKACLQESKLDLALKNLYSGLKKTKNVALDLKIEFYKVIAEVYAAKYDYRKASQYKDSTYIASEKIYQKRKSELYANNQLRFELLNLEKDLALEKFENKSKRNNLFLVISCLFLLLIILGLLFKNRIERFKKIQKIKENQLKESKDEILKHNSFKILLEEKLLLNEKNALIEKEKLKFEIEQRNLKITEKILLQTTKNELIQNIINILDSQTQKLSDPSLEALLGNLKEYLSIDTKWDNYVSLFEDINPQFIKALQYEHSNLSADDIRFLSYLYLNFQTKEISSLLNITPEGVRKRKERILKKMNLSHDTNLFNYLITLEK